MKTLKRFMKKVINAVSEYGELYGELVRDNEEISFAM